jgi:hypothetical protein
MIRKIHLVILPVLFIVFSLKAQNYPFVLPDNFTATLNINTSVQEEYNNLLLGTNIHELAKSDGSGTGKRF